MELELKKYSNGKVSTEYVKIEKMKNKIQPKSLLFITEFDTEENGHKINYLDIKKVQFIANCKTKFENEILVAFYINCEGYMEGYVITNLPEGYDSYQGYLIDYKSYSDICEMTNETKLSIDEYFEQIKNSYIGVNTIATFQEKKYNYTEQDNMWKLVNNTRDNNSLV